MKLVKFKTVGAVVTHLDPNKEYIGINHNGMLYLPSMSVEDHEEDEEAAPKKEPKKATVSKVVKEEPAEVEEEAAPAKPAAKPKARGAKVVEEKEEAPKGGDFTKEVTQLCNDFDKADISEANFITALVTATGGDKAKIKTAVGVFAADADMKIKDAVALILEAAGTGEVAVAAKPKRGAKAEVAQEIAEDEEGVEHSTLEVGDKVKVFWASEDAWFKGEVSAVKRNGDVLVDYVDGTSETLEEDDVVNLI